MIENTYDKIVKGYKCDDACVIIEDTDFEAATQEKRKIIGIQSFVDVVSVNRFITELPTIPNPRPRKNKAYALLLEALKKSGRAGLAALPRAEYQKPCTVHPVDKDIVLIRFQEQIHDQEEAKCPRVDRTIFGAAGSLVEV
ncbi:Ku protein [Mucilaginibacter jinjuensis]|uniref:Ku domain-containing protein n=1 Tax=Mucilaginibacter jinjuensis TaxID=1176721 RepID=A0ABY7TAA2_9SPHI|nr:Ku protein [Mucilaginibacter jinjuensis]WCT13440.1 hypothetical protein PQO05_05770 [Mucilaginibacter jinjuensis]